jgi:hypothetical protein
MTFVPRRQTVLALCGLFLPDEWAFKRAGPLLLSDLQAPRQPRQRQVRDDAL